MNAKQKRTAIQRYKNVLVKHIAPILEYAATLVQSGDIERAEKELREAAANIRREFTK